MSLNSTVYLDFDYESFENNFTIKGIITPIIIVVSSIIQVMIIVLYACQHKSASRQRISANILIGGNSCTFLVTLLLPLPWNIYAFGLNNIHKHTINCFLWNLFDVIVIGAYSSEMWIIVALLYQRYLILKWPMQANSWWSPRRSVVIVVMATLFGFILNTLRILSFGFDVKLKEQISNTSSHVDVYICERNYAVWVENSQAFEIGWSLTMVLSLVVAIAFVLYILISISRTVNKRNCTLVAKGLEINKQDLSDTNTSDQPPLDTNMNKYVIGIQRNSHQKRSLRVSTRKIATMAITLVSCHTFMCVATICICIFRVLQDYGICLDKCKLLENAIIKGLVGSLAGPIIIIVLCVSTVHSFLLTKQVNTMLSRWLRRV